MTTFYERVVNEIAHFDRPTDRALRAVVARHEPEQHYTVGQDNRRTPSRLYCRTCRATSPCEEIKTIAEHLGVTDEDGSV